MQTLYQKHHGLPAMGIQGKQGKTGKTGQSVYIGFINDFFDYTEFDINANVKYTKRKQSQLIKSNTLWKNYKEMYPNADLETMYYTGEFVTVNASPDREDYDPRLTKIDMVSYNDALPGTSLDPTLDEQPVESYEFNMVTDTVYIQPDGTILNYSEIYDFEQPDEKDPIGVPVPTYNVRLDLEHISYDYGDLKRIMSVKLKKGWEFNLYTALDDDAQPAQTELSGPEAIEFWRKDPVLYPLFVRERLEGDFSKYIIDTNQYVTEQIIKYDIFNNQFVDYVSYPLGEDFEYLSDNFNAPLEDNLEEPGILTKLCYIKRPIKVYPRYTTQKLYKESNYYTDDDGYMYIGLADNILYELTKDENEYELNDFPIIMEKIRQTNPDDIINMTDLLAVSKQVFRDAVRDYKVTLAKNTDELIPDYKDPEKNVVIWYPGNVKQIKIPTTLSSDIGVGDIIYFYTDESVFSATSQIEYMVVITEELLNADIDKLISAANIVNPFEYSVMDSDIVNNRAVINNITSIMAVTDGVSVTNGFQSFQMKSLENVLSQKDDCTLRLISAENDSKKKPGLLRMYAQGSAFNNEDKAQAKTDSTTPVYNFDVKESEDSKVTFYTNNNQLAIHNLAVNLHDKDINFELTDIVYDKNVDFQNGYFIYDKMTSDNIISEYIMAGFSTSAIQNFSYVINRSDFFKDPESIGDKMSEYYIGYYLMHNNQVIASEEIKGDTLEIDIQPIALPLLRWNNVIWKRDFYFIEKEFADAKLVYKKAQNLPSHELDATDQKVIDRVYKNKNYGYDYDVIFTLRNETGFRYYSNKTKLSFVIENMIDGQSKKDEVVAVIVTPEYPDSVDLTKNVHKGYNNITWEFDALTADEDLTGREFNIHLNDPSIKVKNILLNSRDITNSRVVRNSWLTIEKDINSDLKYLIRVKDNVPDIKESNGDVYSTTSVVDYMKLLSDKPDTSVNSQLFNILDTQSKPMASADRSIKIAVLYEKDGEDLYEEYVITQPGFKDTRKIPEIKLNLSSCQDNLTEVNTLENGVLCNQFKTYLDIEINNFSADDWGLCGTDDVYLSFDLTNIDFDNEYISKYSIENPYRQPTFRFIPVSETTVYKYIWYERYGTFNVPNNMYSQFANLKINQNIDSEYDKILGGTQHIAYTDMLNHYEIEFTSENYQDNFEVKQDVFYTSKTGALPAEVISEDNKTYVPMNSDFISACMHPYEPTSGMLHNITLSFKKLKLSDIIKNNKIRVAIDFAMGNPIQAKMLLGFVVNNLKIHYKGAEFGLSAKKSGGNYLLRRLGQRSLYRYKSNILDVTFHPIEMIAAPCDEETNITQISGAVKKVGVEDPVKVSIGFYNKTVYKTRLPQIASKFNYQTIRVRQLYTRWSDMELKSGYFQDNISSINIQPVNPMDVIDILGKDNKQLEISSLPFSLLNNNKMSGKADLKSGTSFLSILFNAAETMNPKYRDGSETFIYNNKEYLTQRYNQYINESPMFVSIDGTLQIRSKKELDSMDAWNFEYQVNCGNQENSLLMKGENNTYGNAYLFLDDKYDTGQYDENGLMRLKDLKEAAEKSCRDIRIVKPVTSHEMHKKEYYPENGKIFRTLMSDLSWEFPWFESGRIKHSLMVSGFDLLLMNQKDKFVSNVYQTRIKDILKTAGSEENLIGYNLCYKIDTRIGFNSKTGGTEVLMLRKPGIGLSSDEIDLQKVYLNSSGDYGRHNSGDYISDIIS